MAAKSPITVKIEVDSTERIIIIVTPCNSIIMDQCLQLCEREINACYLDFKCHSTSAFAASLEEEEQADALHIL